MLKPITQTGVTDGPVETLPAHDRGHDRPQHVAFDVSKFSLLSWNRHPEPKGTIKWVNRIASHGDATL
jgi:hypothetical protein